MNKRGRKPKSNFYHIRNKVRINETQAAEVLGVTVQEIQDWDKKGAPAMAERLLLLWDRKYINHNGWDGWLFSRGVLMHKRQRWRPETILECRKCSNELWKAKEELEEINRELKTWKGIAKIIIKKIKIK